MKVLRSNGQVLCIFMSVLTLLISIPPQSVFAALIDTETAMNSIPGDDARNKLNQFLAREDVRDALIANGIDPLEAKRRIDALSDEEVKSISDRIEELPAGSGAIEFLIVVLLALFLLFIILDLTGVTDVFTFIK